MPSGSRKNTPSLKEVEPCNKASYGKTKLIELYTNSGLWEFVESLQNVMEQPSHILQHLPTAEGPSKSGYTVGCHEMITLVQLQSLSNTIVFEKNKIKIFVLFSE